MPQNPTDVHERIKGYLLSNFRHLKAEQIFKESHFYEDLNLDSMDITEMIMGLEEKFGVEITDVEADTHLTVETLTQLLEEKLAQHA